MTQTREHDWIEDLLPAGVALFRLKVVADILNTPEPTIRTWIHREILPGVKLEQNLYVERPALIRFIRESKRVRIRKPLPTVERRASA